MGTDENYDIAGVPSTRLSRMVGLYNLIRAEFDTDRNHRNDILKSKGSLFGQVQGTDTEVFRYHINPMDDGMFRLEYCGDSSCYSTSIDLSGENVIAKLRELRGRVALPSASKELDSNTKIDNSDDCNVDVGPQQKARLKELFDIIGTCFAKDPDDKSCIYLKDERRLSGSVHGTNTNTAFDVYATEDGVFRLEYQANRLDAGMVSIELPIDKVVVKLRELRDAPHLAHTNISSLGDMHSTIHESFIADGDNDSSVHYDNKKRMISGFLRYVPPNEDFDRSRTVKFSISKTYEGGSFSVKCSDMSSWDEYNNSGIEPETWHITLKGHEVVDYLRESRGGVTLPPRDGLDKNTYQELARQKLSAVLDILKKEYPNDGFRLTTVNTDYSDQGKIPTIMGFLPTNEQLVTIHVHEDLKTLNPYNLEYSIGFCPWIETEGTVPSREGRSRDLYEGLQNIAVPLGPDSDHADVLEFLRDFDRQNN